MRWDQSETNVLYGAGWESNSGQQHESRPLISHGLLFEGSTSLLALSFHSKQQHRPYRGELQVMFWGEVSSCMVRVVQVPGTTVFILHLMDAASFFFFFLPYSTLCFFVGFFFGLVWVGLGFAIEPVCHAGTLTVCSHTSPEGLAEVFRVQQLPLITILGGLFQELHSSLASDKPLLQAVFRLFFSSKG